MKVTFLVSHFPELSEQFIINQIVGLIDQGIDISIVSLHKGKDKVNNNDLYEYDLIKKTIYVSIPENALFRLIFGLLLIIKLSIISPRKLLKTLNINKYKRAARSFKLLYVYNFLRCNRIRVLHCHFGPNGNIGAFLKEIGIVENLITTFHGSDINTYPLKHGENIYNELFSLVDKITVNTSFTAKKVCSYGANKEKIKIVPVGLKVRDYPFLKENYDFTNNPVILTVARLAEKKGHRYAIEAIAKLKKKIPNILYNVIGSGPMESDLKKLVEELRIDDSVIFHGSCNRVEIFEFYKKTSIFILPSVIASDGDMEGQGLVLQEAQAVGLPVISTFHNGIPDGVVNGKTGLLVPERDSNVLAEKIEYLLENPKTCNKMGKNGRDFVTMNYDIEKLSLNIIDVYKSV